MAISKIEQIFTALFLAAVIVITSIPMDYDGISPQEAFALSFEAHLPESIADFYSLSDLNNERDTLLAQLEYFAGEIELPFIPAQDILDFIMERESLISYVEGFKQLFGKENILQIAEGWYVQLLFMSFPGIVMDGIFGNLSDLAQGIDFADAIDSIFGGEGITEELMQMDIHDRYSAMGRIIALWFAHNLYEIEEFMQAQNLQHEIGIEEQIQGEHIWSVFHFNEDNLEERFAETFIGKGDVQSVSADIHINTETRLNVFFANHGEGYVSIRFIPWILVEETRRENEWGFIETSTSHMGAASPFDIMLAPGQRFTIQLPYDILMEFNSIQISAQVLYDKFEPFEIEMGLRPTNNPL